MDAGVVIRVAYIGDPATSRIVAAIKRLDREGWEMCFAPQAIREAMNALTRPVESGGYGLCSPQALDSLQNAGDSFTLLPDNLDVFHHWQSLVAKYAVVGKSVHDANVVATALAHGATHILTLNERDFRRYAEVGIIVP